MIIKKTPALETILAMLTDEEMSEFQKLLNNNTEEVYYSLVENDYLPPNENKIVASTFRLDKTHIVNGFFIATETQCVFIAYKKQDVYLYKIDVPHRTYKEIKEYYTLSDLRYILYEVITRDNIAVDKTGDVEFGKNVTIDGNLKVNGTATIDEVNISTEKSDTTQDVTFKNTHSSSGNAVLSIPLGQEVNILHDKNTKQIFGKYSLFGDGNIDLFEHFIKVKSGNTLICNFVILSSVNTPIDSVQDFRTVMNENTFHLPIGVTAHIDSTPTTLKLVDGSTETTLLDKTWSDDVSAI